MARNFLIAAFFCFLALDIAFAEDMRLKALKDELGRSMKELRINGLSDPYYISYRLKVVEVLSVKASKGALISGVSNKTANLSCEVRVGGYELDNTNFFDVGLNFFGSGDDEERFTRRLISYEADYDQIRRECWLASDAAYKQANEIYSKKLAVLKSRVLSDTIPDFLKAAPLFSVDTLNNLIEPDRESMTELTRALSGRFASASGIMGSEVSYEFIRTRVYYINSEGMTYIKDDLLNGLEAACFGQKQNGLPLFSTYSFYSKLPSALPSSDSLARAMDRMIDNLEVSIRSEKLGEDYYGPVIFSGQAACELAGQSLAPNFVAQREVMSESGFNDLAKNDYFQKKLQGRVLPENMTVTDKPEMAEYNGTELFGNYVFDDEGLPAGDVVLVEKGLLKTLLTSRVPTKRIRKSNAHYRSGGPMFSNIFIQKEKKDKTKDLKKEALALCKKRKLPFALVIKGIMNQNLLYTKIYELTFGNFDFPRDEGKFIVTEGYKIYADGREEKISGMLLSGMGPASFKDAVFGNTKEYVYNCLMPSVVSPFYSGGDQYLGCSVISPDFLIEDCEINSWDDNFKTKPILKIPIQAGKNE